MKKNSISTKQDDHRLCSHEEIKMKMVSWAYKVKNKHEQGFRWAPCCTKCGVLLHIRN